MAALITCRDAPWSVRRHDDNQLMYIGCSREHPYKWTVLHYLFLQVLQIAVGVGTAGGFDFVFEVAARAVGGRYLFFTEKHGDGCVGET